jgi:putative restriction endonuclease
MASQKVLSIYINKFSKLRTDKTGGWNASTQNQAPHKPFLLLAVLDLFAQGRISSNLIEINAELGELFAGYWSSIMPANHRGNMALPFFHMRSSSFWHLVPIPGQEAALKATRQLSSLNQLHKLILGARLDDELFQILQFEENRNVLRSVLVQTYFSPEFQVILLNQGETNLQSFLYGQQLIEQAKKKLKEAPENGEEYQPSIRDQGFRRAVVKLYEHRCAFCGVRMLTVEGRTVVDAAHIVPWSISHNDDVHNGMALCRLCHWTFDEGLLGVSTKYIVMLSAEMRIAQNVPGHLLTLEGRSILGPEDRDYWPDPGSLRWHKQHVFRDV